MLNIAIAGLGTVGIAVFKTITQKSQLLTKRCEKKLEIIAVSSRDKSKNRDIDISGVKWYENPLGLAFDENIDIVIETIGGDDIAYQLCKKSLENHKHVVTANKAMIAKYGFELVQIAEKNNVALMFEAAVAGGIPILKSLREGLAANKYTNICGILNGTCNYILSMMEETGKDFDDILQDAQDLGYAETPPDLDIDGTDTAHKLAIITAIAYGSKPSFEDIYCEGIREITLDDIKYSDELGYKIKLLANVTQNTKIEQSVYPTLVSKNNPISAVSGGLNAILVDCDSFGEAFFTGAGAGGFQTASSVVADILDIASNRNSPSFGCVSTSLIDGDFADISTHKGEYYIRINVEDKDGVLASISTILNEEKISVDKLLQKTNGDKATVILTTHITNEIFVNSAIDKISKMSYITDKINFIRIL